MTKVFISYSHDSDAHRERVLDLSNRLRDDGIESWIDRYEPTPPEGWPRKLDKEIREASFVLMVCTATYLKRLQLEEEEGKGLGVAWEGSLIYNTLYRDRTLNNKFIPVLFTPEDKPCIPIIIFGNNYYDLSMPRGYGHLYRHLRGELGVVMPALGKKRFVRTIHSDALPTVEGELFGRKDELALLDKALLDADTHVVQFVASGGTGKTKLLRHWLDENHDKIEALIAWSFYSQGSGEDKQISATPFFMQALKSLGSDKDISDFNTEEEKGEYIADLLRERRCLLVLDGLEPLQQVGRGELKDRAIRKLLRCLVGNHSSLCIITTRLPVHELKGRRRVVQHDLQNIAPEDGVALLRSFGVSGRDVDMLAAVQEYGRHALALHLLGNALATYLDGDVRKRDTLTELVGDCDDVERHAYKVMQAYEQWLEGTPELKLLYLLGLFDHPVEQEVLEVLWEAEIPGLTEGVDKRAWSVAQRDLTHKYQMMSVHEEYEDLFDCHPLIREYFGRQLKETNAEIWQQAHTVLYEYYKGLPKRQLPKTLEEMQPLLRAVQHGCAAGLYLESWVEVVWARIEQKPENYVRNSYLVDQLGAWSEALSLIANYFTTPWTKLAFEATADIENNIFNRTASSLDMLGRYTESIKAQRFALLAAQKADSLSSLEAAVVNSYSLTLSLIDIGSLDEAKINTLITLQLAFDSGAPQARIAALCALGRVLYQQGLIDQAISKYQEAEDISAQSTIPFLHSVYGSHFCEILIDINKEKEARKRSARALKKCSYGYSKLSIFSDQLVLCKSWLAEKNSKQALGWLNKARLTLNGLDSVCQIVEYHLVNSKFKFVGADFRFSGVALQEAYEIAEPSGMRLHLTDYHLEMARLILAVEADQTQYPEATPDREQRILPFADQEEPGILTLESHISTAAKLIEDTGYHRRDAELAELKQQVGMP